MEKAFQQMSAGPEPAEERSACQSPDSILLKSCPHSQGQVQAQIWQPLLTSPDSLVSNENKTNKAEKQQQKAVVSLSKNRCSPGGDVWARGTGCDLLSCGHQAVLSHPLATLPVALAAWCH